MAAIHLQRAVNTAADKDTRPMRQRHLNIAGSAHTKNGVCCEVLQLVYVELPLILRKAKMSATR